MLADFGDAVLAGRSCKTGAKFVTWEWDFDRQGVHAGHYFMENYEAAKQDFAVRAGLVESQRLFSDEQIAVIKNACEFALEDDATLSPSALFAELPSQHRVTKIRKYLVGIIQTDSLQRGRAIKDLHILFDLCSHLCHCP